MFPIEWMLDPNPPNSTIGLMLISMILMFISTLANRLLVDQKKMREWRTEINEWNTKFREALKKKDSKLIEKLKKQQPRILQLQAKMFKQSMKVTAIFFVPFMLIFIFLSGNYGTYPVAQIPGLFPIPFYYWYLICTTFFNIIFSRLLGVSLGGMD